MDLAVTDNALMKVALVLRRFRDMSRDHTIAAIATDDGGATHFTYGHLQDLLSAALDARDRLHRISTWHSRESGPAGTVGDYCVECGEVWPCDTRRMADGTYTDE